MPPPRLQRLGFRPRRQSEIRRSESLPRWSGRWQPAWRQEGLSEKKLRLPRGTLQRFSESRRAQSAVGDSTVFRPPSLQGHEPRSDKRQRESLKRHEREGLPLTPGARLGRREGALRPLAEAQREFAHTSRSL